MVTSRMDIHSICKAAAFLKDDDVFSRPLHVWSTENRHREHSQRLSGQAAVMISLSVPSLLGDYQRGPLWKKILLVLADLLPGLAPPGKISSP